MKNMLRALAALTIALPTVAAHAIDLPRDHRVPGGVATIVLGGSAEPPSVRFNDQPVLVVKDGTQWTAVLGIGLASKPGPASVLVQRNAATDNETLRFEIAPFKYSEQRLKVPPGKVDLSKADLARYERERVHLAAVAATFSATPPSTLRLLQPTPGVRSSSFGLRRVFNGQSRNPHSGMDLSLIHI